MLVCIWKPLGIGVPVSAVPAAASPPSGPDRYYGRRLLGFASWLRRCCQQRGLHNYRNREQWGIAVLSVPLLNECVVLLPQFTLSHDSSMSNRAIIIHFMCRDTQRHCLAEMTWIYSTDVFSFKNRTILKSSTILQHSFLLIFCFFFL